MTPPGEGERAAGRSGRIDMRFRRLTQLAFGYWMGQPLFALTELGVFDAIGGGTASVSSLMEELDLDPAAAGDLVAAGVALGLLERNPDGGLRNGPLAERFLRSDSDESLVHWVRVMGRWAGPWMRLGDVARSGRRSEAREARLGDDPAYLEDFILGMHEYNRRSGPELADALALDGVRHLVDVGGGAGTYSIAACEAEPELRASLIDLPDVLPLAERVVRQAGLEARIRLVAGDYTRDALGEGADLVLLSYVLHQEQDEVCDSILRRSREALVPGGRVVVHGHFLAPDRMGPIFPVLHGLAARVLWEGGRSRADAEMVALLEKAGFAEVESRQLSGTGLVSGRAP